MPVNRIGWPPPPMPTVPLRQPMPATQPVSPSGWSMNLSGLNPLVNALMSRWNQAMDYKLSEMQGERGRNERAYAEWLKKRELEREVVETGMRERGEDRARAEDARIRAERQAEAAERGADMERRAALMASVDRTRTLQAQYGGPTPWSAAGTVADFYEYGAGNPQGRGGGGNARELSDEVGGIGSPEWKEMGIQNCINNPLGPGCEGILKTAGYTEEY